MSSAHPHQASSLAQRPLLRTNYGINLEKKCQQHDFLLVLRIRQLSTAIDHCTDGRHGNEGEHSNAAGLRGDDESAGGMVQAICAEAGDRAN